MRNRSLLAICPLINGFSFRYLAVGWLFAAGSFIFAAPVELYVAPNGADTNPGTVEEPFRTLYRAREAGWAVSALELSPVLAEKVDLVFGLAGSHVHAICDALIDAEDIRFVVCKHENNAALMADMYGIDISRSMTDILKKKLSETEHHRIKTGDAVTMKWDCSFELIIAPFRMFSHILEVEQQLALLNNVCNHLTETGKFIFDVFVRIWYQGNTSFIKY